MDIFRPTPQRSFIPDGPQMRSYDPTIREILGNYIYDMANQIGLPARRMKNEGMMALDLVPGLGETMGLEEAKRDYDAGSILPAAIGGGLTVAGMVPVAGDVVSAVGRRGLKRLPQTRTITRPSVVEGTSGLAQTDSLDVQATSPDYSAAPFSSERYRGAAPDRSEKTFLRYRPKKVSDRVKRSLDALSDPTNPARMEMDDVIARGAELGGDDWYNTEELRDWFVAELGEEEGNRQWAEYLELMGTTSPGSRVEPNIANASAVRQRMYNDPAYTSQLSDVDKLADASPLAKSRPKGYGHKTAGLQELVTARRQQGAWEGVPEPGVPPAQGSWVQNPKPKGFAQSLLGNQQNIAADLHFTRYMGMASQDPEWLINVTDVSAEFADDIMARYPKARKHFKTRKVNGKDVYSFSPKKAVKDGSVPMEDIENYASVWTQKPNDNEYAAFEDFISEYARDTGRTPAQIQANLWMGAADATGVDPASQATFMEIIRNRARKTADKRGATMEQVLREFIQDKGLLSMAGTVGLTGAALSSGLIGGAIGQDEF